MGSLSAISCTGVLTCEEGGTFPVGGVDRMRGFAKERINMGKFGHDEREIPGIRP